MNKKVFIWGTGYRSNQVMEQLSSFIFSHYEVLGFIDNNQTQHGKIFYGKPVMPPLVLTTMDYDFVVLLMDEATDVRRNAIQVYGCNPTLIKDKYFFHEASILERYGDSNESEIKEVINNIKKNGLQVFNYNFVDSYKKIEVEVAYDKSWGGYYVNHNGRKMYMRKGLNTYLAAKDYYCNLLMEQDMNSPHRYIGKNNPVKKGDVIIDAGAAEGIFALDYVDVASKIYLVEVDDEWIEALRKTFESYMGKVELVPKFLSDINNASSITIDHLLQGSTLNYLKMDIEGNEFDALKGAENSIRQSKDFRSAICCYHTDYDEELLKAIINEYGLKYELSKGYMWFPYFTKNKYVSDRLRRGIIRTF